MRNFSLKSKIIAIFVFMVILPLLAASLGNLYLVIKNREQNVLEYQNLAVNNAEEKITKYFNQKIDNLQLVISGPHTSLYELRASEIYFFLNNSFNAERYKKLDLIDKKGNLLASISGQNQFSLNQAYEQSMSSTSEHIQNYQEFIAGQKLSTISRVEGNVSSLADYQAAIQGEKYFGEVEFVDGQELIRIASQVKNSNQEIIGVISAELSLQEITAQTNSIKLGNNGGIFLLDSEGIVLSQGFGNSFPLYGNLNSIPEIVKLKNNGQIGLGSYTQFDYKEQKRTIAGKKVNFLNWFIVTDWTVDDAFSVVGNILNQSFAILFALVFLSAAMGLLFSRQIIKPIEKLAKGVKRISEGKFDHQIEIKSKDEFRLLADQFNKMTKVLEENKNLRDEFVFVAAHELRTPVTAIKGYMEMLLDGSFGQISQQTADTLKIVNKANDRLVQLVQDLLEIARSEAGKMKIEIAPLVINDLVKQTQSELKSLSDEKGIEVKYTADKEYKILADQGKLQEVLINIVGNAIKYTIGNGAIEVWHEIKDGFLYTYIKDHGIGLSPEELKQLFSKFYRAQNQDTAQIQGTGLGLFICKEIIEKMGGQIFVESKRGQGSTFGFSLRLEK